MKPFQPMAGTTKGTDTLTECDQREKKEGEKATCSLCNYDTEKDEGEERSV